MKVGYTNADIRLHKERPSLINFVKGPSHSPGKYLFHHVPYDKAAAQIALSMLIRRIELPGKLVLDWTTRDMLVGGPLASAIIDFFEDKLEVEVAEYGFNGKYSDLDSATSRNIGEEYIDLLIVEPGAKTTHREAYAEQVRAFISLI